MFDTLSQKLESFFKSIRGQAKFSEKNIEEISQRLRMTLLEADVNFKVAKIFIERVNASALGKKVHESLTPQQHYIDIVCNELTTLLGEVTSEIDVSQKPLIVLMVGLQGSGKTTTSAKLAKFLEREKKRSVLLISTDVYRPAAMEQLKILAQQIKIPYFDSNPSQRPLDICRLAMKEAAQRGSDAIIVDTAGRLQIDEPLMQELSDIKRVINPHEILLVADAMTGQEAVRIASGFHECVGLTGIVLSKFDSDARGGAALSMKYITGQPIKFVGTGEKVEALEVFHPDRMAKRMLKMGDVLTLIERVKKIHETAVVKEETSFTTSKYFTLEDFKEHLQKVKKIGSFQELMGMIPGANRLMSKVGHSLPSEQVDQEMKKMVAMIDSMTIQERRYVDILNGSRKLRVAKGSGVQVSDVNKLIKQYLEAKKMMKRMSKFGKRLPLSMGEGLW